LQQGKFSSPIPRQRFARRGELVFGEPVGRREAIAADEFADRLGRIRRE